MIGGAFLSATVQTLVEKLASKEFLDYIKNTKLNVSLMKQLKTTLLTLQAVLDDAEQKQINNPAVKQWLDDLKDAVFDAEDLLNQISYDSLRCKVENTQAGNKSNQVWNFLSSPFKNLYGEINSQMKIMCESLQLFAQHKVILGLQTKSARVSHRTPSSSVVNESVMVGRTGDKDRLIDVLVSDSGSSRNNRLGVVAILGMGGVGKTTLAQLVYNDEKVEKYFDLKAWVCVSEDFDVVRITKSLLECVVINTTIVNSKVWESNNLDILQVELMKHLMDRRFLFVLDDIWNDNYIDWDELIAPLVNRETRSKVIITTREQKVAEVARTFPIYKLEPLSDEDCWSLLSKHSFGSEDYCCGKYPNLEEIGKKIAGKCGGLPIAAKTLGGLMRSKVDEKEWIAILNSDTWNLRNDKIMPALHLSYQYLPSHLKRCFSYCSIFPKDYPLDRKKLVWMWMAEGFLDYSKGDKMAEEVGDDYFSELLSRSLIQQSNDDAHGEKFFMHDLVNDLATFISGKSCCRLECDNISKNVRHLSYNQEYYDNFMKFKNLYNFKFLRSFLPTYVPISLQRAHNYLSIKVIDDLIPSLKRLRMLTLSDYGNITMLPDSIGNLVQLQYLDLSFTRIKSLPDTTCNLYNLQTLILCGCCDLTKLPMNMVNLINLRHLDISGTAIKELPIGIGELENLQTLTVFVVGKGQIGLGIKELKKFPHLQGKLTIKNLHNVIDAKEAHDANLKSKEKIEELELLWGKQSEDSLKVKVVLDMLQPPKYLKSLKIDLYGGTNFPSWLGNSLFANMVSLCISNCEYCVTLPPLGQLPSLKDLEIYGLKILETIGPEFYFVKRGEGSNSPFQPFPSLEHMKLHNMPNWKEWFPFEGNNFSFPRLRTLKLHGCPELRRHLPSHLSSIEEIEIEGCDNLLTTPPTLHWLSSIKKMKIAYHWSFDDHAERIQQTLLERDSPCLLQSIKIMMCLSLFSWPKMIMNSTCLQQLELYEIQSPVAFPVDGLPTSLRSLIIFRCEKFAFMPPEMWSNYTSLEGLYLQSSCCALTSFPLDGFPALQRLDISDCKSLDSIFILESPPCRPSSLLSLSIVSHNSIESLKFNVRMDTLTALEELFLQCSKLSFCAEVCLPPKLQKIDIVSYITTPPVTEWGLQGLTALSRLSIGCCDDIVNTLLNEPLLPISLVNLTIIYLDEMKSFDGNGLQHLSSLENLAILNCEQLQSIPENCLPSSLKSLGLYYCKKLESLPEDSLPYSLKKLDIYGCPLLEERYKRKEHWCKIAHIPVIEINYQVTI